MSDSASFLVLDRPCETAIDWLTRQVNSAGLKVIRTFDLQVARHSQVDCSCPYHGTDLCDCQMVVLLIYGSEHQWVSVQAHGYNGQTCFSVVDTPQQRADPHLVSIIRQAIAPHLGVTAVINDPNSGGS